MSDIELDYVEERGPGVLELPAALAQEQLEPEGQPTETLPGWEQETVEQFLRGTGAGLHMLAGVAEKDWLMTKADLDRIAPPLTRIANRYEPALRLSPLADPLLVAHGFALYGWRSALERKRALRDTEEEPVGDGYERVEANQETVEIDLDEPADAPYFPESPKAQP